MLLNQKLIELLKVLKNSQQDKIKQVLTFNSESVQCYSGGEEMVSITGDSVVLLNKKDLTPSLLKDAKKSFKSNLDVSKCKIFFDEIKDSFVRLNHLGIKYYCANISNELAVYKKLSLGTNFKLYEEESDNLNENWYFIGNTKNWQDPLFEIVLKNKISPYDWLPHFQVDIDTNLTMTQLDNITNHIFGPNFFEWKLKFPNYGVVLGMGLLGNINGTKICLGVGTNLRKTQYHREEILKEV